MKAPTGHVTLVFTDVEGSTVLWEKLPDAMREGLAVHNRVMRAEIGRYSGYEVKTEGDAFMVAFPDVPSACLFCLGAQRNLLSADWPESLLRRPEAAVDVANVFKGLRVRMGIHVGTPDCRLDPTTGRMDYFGPMVNRAARVSGAGHGGQILVSGEVLKEMRSVSELDAETIDLGEHGLKGIDQPVHLYQIGPTTLSERRFPPIKTADIRRTNLQEDATSFIGRDKERLELFGMLEKPSQVTLIGAGGLGKTRLARMLGRELFPKYTKGGVWFCDVSAANSLEEFLSVVAEVLGIPLAMNEGTDGHVGQIGRVLDARGKLLLILDNVEQIVEVVAPVIDRWRQASPANSILVTSRVALEVSGESLYELSPLSVEHSLKLFEARAQAVTRSWKLTSEARPNIEKLVTRLDHIPLAIELAAARVGVLSPVQLLAKLEHDFDILRSRERTALSRQATVRGAVEWSWNLLKPWQQSALAACGIFNGGFTFDAFEAVVGSKKEGPDSLEILESLKSCSMIRLLSQDDGELRFGMFESIRQFAREQLGTSAPFLAAARAHAAFFLAEAERRQGSDHVSFVSKERENIIAVQRNLLRVSWSEAARAVRIITSFLRDYSPTPFFQDLVDSTINAAPPDADPGLLAHVLSTRANYRAWFGRRSEAVADMDRAGELSARSPDTSIRGHVLHAQGMMQMMMGDMARGRTCFEAALPLVEHSSAQDLWSQILESMALQAFFCGRLHEQLELLSRALAVPSTKPGSLRWAMIIRSIGESQLSLGQTEDAQKNLQQAYPVAREFGDRETESHIDRLLGTLALVEDSREQALLHFDKASTSARDLCNHAHLAIVMRLRAIGLLLSGRAAEAVEVLEASIPVVETCAIRQLQGPLYSFLGSAHALAGNHVHAEKAFSMAESFLSDGANHWQVEAQRVLKAVGDGTRPRDEAEALARGDGLRQDSVDLVLARKVLAFSLNRKNDD